jgi:hypothetical protein
MRGQWTRFSARGCKKVENGVQRRDMTASLSCSLALEPYRLWASWNVRRPIGLMFLFESDRVAISQAISMT